MIAMADIGTLTPDVEETVANWVKDGGTLVRFAGPRLASATDALIPVKLRHGDTLPILGRVNLNRGRKPRPKTAARA